MKSKYSVLLFSILLSSFLSLHATGIVGTLSGKILDKADHKPVPGAVVTINDLKLSVVADNSGNYFFRSVPTGSYLLEVTSIGYLSVTTNVTVAGNTTLDIELEQHVLEQSEVVVTGMSRATQIRRSPIPIVSVSHDALTTNLSTNIINALTKVPGVTAITTGPNVSKPSIRGLGFNRILTLYDGVRLEGQQWGEEHGIEVDQYSIDRVEIVKGAASLTYGSDAVAGVVNLIPTQPATEGRIKGDVLAEYQSNNGMFGGSAMLSGTYKGFEWLGRLSHKQATNYRNRIEGRVYGTAFNETDGTAYLGYHGAWGFSHLSFSMYDDKQEIPSGSRDPLGRFTKQITEADTVRPVVTPAELTSYKITDIHQLVRHYRVYSNNSFSIKNSRLTLNLAYQNSIRQEFSHPEIPAIAGLYLNLKTYNYDVKYFFPETQGWNFTVGVNGMYQTNDVTSGTEFVIPSYNQFDVGPFAMLKKSFGKVDVSGGLRYDSRNFHSSELYTVANPVTGFDMPVHGADTAGANKSFSAYSTVFSGVSGSFGVTYNVTQKLSFKANVARGYRAPNISEISSNGVHPGTNIYQIGNVTQPEFSFQEDLGMTYASKYIVVDFSLFNNNVSNYIFNQRLLSAFGGDSVLVPGNQTYKFQQGKARLYGGEINIDLHPIKSLHFENSISLVYGDNMEANGIKLAPGAQYLPFIPPFHGLSELRYDFASKAYHLSKGYVKAQVVYYAAQNRVYSTDNTETPTPGYALFNLGLGTGITNKKGAVLFNLSVIANNLFDVAYFSHTSRLKYFYYDANDTNPAHGIHEMGRNIALRIDVPLNLR